MKQITVAAASVVASVKWDAALGTSWDAVCWFMLVWVLSVKAPDLKAYSGLTH